MLHIRRFGVMRASNVAAIVSRIPGGVEMERIGWPGSETPA